ncbi:prevent-host-death protein [Xaviernesmea oryzae]|uniref:Prevent-host-death protein n=1 Tax=Xaviernesmea oryzae TaxID=464029 RepID=A0A1Q9AVN6_9HYPH|nr:prevent-host-death protein [Xaviernesmea oryzae]OLP59499.1 prevent-host-death protein [Xaviernesmea oryzae]
MTILPLIEAEGQLRELARRVEAGERITLTLDGKPVIELVPPEKTTETGSMPGLEAFRAYKREKGIDSIFTYVAEDFDDPLPVDFLITPLPALEGEK